ncbi:uncharacterized protein LOC133783819 [Humulus lupulus]|uniref:uncharacterized protein LOC133783819 n=1 Tax=Humulus lupulus TaxID=3486 RepID=UPI002B410999|nr:uncharacterized protein LOC133783819 [Humulus lupulus]
MSPTSPTPPLHHGDTPDDVSTLDHGGTPDVPVFAASGPHTPDATHHDDDGGTPDVPVLAASSPHTPDATHHDDDDTCLAESRRFAPTLRGKKRMRRPLTNPFPTLKASGSTQNIFAV